MRDDAGMLEPYEPPSIQEHTPIDVPLIGAGGASSPPGSAAFRCVPAGPYAAPRIEARHPLDDPLIAGPAAVSTPVVAPSAAFRPLPPRPYTVPRIVARDPLDIPLIGLGSGADNDNCASFHSQ